MVTNTVSYDYIIIRKLYIVNLETGLYNKHVSKRLLCQLTFMGHNVDLNVVR
jgi:hypothetical protein